MTDQEKIFELLKYCNNEAVGYARIAKEHEEKGRAVPAAMAKAMSDSFDAVVTKWESLNKK